MQVTLVKLGRSPGGHRAGLPAAQTAVRCAAGAAIRTAASAAAEVARQERTNGALSPSAPITAPPSAVPAANPEISAAATQVNASVSTPGVTARPMSEYWQAKTGAQVRPASRLHATPSGIVRAAISGAVSTTA